MIRNKAPFTDGEELTIGDTQYAVHRVRRNRVAHGHRKSEGYSAEEALNRLGHIEVKPRLTMKPRGRLRSSKRMECNQVIRIHSLQCAAKSIPDIVCNIAASIAADNPK
jgi:hypothetical protein